MSAVPCPSSFSLLPWSLYYTCCVVTMRIEAKAPACSALLNWKWERHTFRYISECVRLRGDLKIGSHLLRSPATKVLRKASRGFQRWKCRNIHEHLEILLCIWNMFICFKVVILIFRITDLSSFLTIRFLQWAPFLPLPWTYSHFSSRLLYSWPPLDLKWVMFQEFVSQSATYRMGQYFPMGEMYKWWWLLRWTMKICRTY